MFLRVYPLYMFLRVPLFFVQALWGVTVFSGAFRRRPRLRRRFAACAAAGFLASLALNLLLQSAGFHYRLALLLSCGMVMLSAYFCWDIPWDMAMLAGANGYLAQHAAGSLKTLLRLLLPALGLPQLEQVVSMPGADLLCYGLTYSILFLLLRRPAARLYLLDRRTRMVFTGVILFLGFGMSHLVKTIEGRPAALVSDELYALGCACLIFCMECLQTRNVLLAQDVAAMKAIVRQQRRQYESSRENTQLINEKYHDLKQMLGALRGRLPERELEALRRHVDEYDAPVQTGNAALDVLLTEKRVQCARQDIRITCLADGAGLGFLDELDVYILVGNALTNAMEAVQALPPGEERFISLNISREGTAAVIHVENPYSGEITFQDGLPQSRRDPKYHGFGMKSMVRVAERYQGALSAQVRDGRFLLDIVLVDGAAGRKISR